MLLFFGICFETFFCGCQTLVERHCAVHHTTHAYELQINQSKINIIFMMLHQNYRIKRHNYHSGKKLQSALLNTKLILWSFFQMYDTQKYVIADRKNSKKLSSLFNFIQLQFYVSISTHVEFIVILLKCEKFYVCFYSNKIYI